MSLLPGTSVTLEPSSEAAQLLIAHDVEPYGTFEIMSLDEVLSEFGHRFQPEPLERLQDIEATGGLFAIRRGDPVMDEMGPMPVYPGEYRALDTEEAA